jgi:long-chain acyl-CoA synthetase
MGTIEQLKKFFIRTKRSEVEIFNHIQAQFRESVDKDIQTGDACDSEKSEKNDTGQELFAGQLLHKAYERFSDKIALIEQQRSISYKELYFRAQLLSQELLQRGVAPGERVFVYFENSIEFYVAYFAAWQIAAIVVPINIFLHARELTHILNDAQPKIIICSTAFHKILDKLVTDSFITALPEIITEQQLDFSTPVPENIEYSYPHFVLKALPRDTCCLLLYTSGTTGVPKGVMLSSRNVMTNAMQSHARFVLSGQNPQERFFCVLPLFHVFAQNTCLWLPVMTGSTVIIVPKIDRALILEGLQKKPTLFFGFPALYGLLCLMKTAPLDSIKMFVSGADMLPDKIRAAFAMIYGRKICSGYGLTEASPVIAVNQCNDDQPTTVVGQPLVGIDCAILDEQGDLVEPGIIGQLWVRGGNIMLGYYNAPDATALVLRDGWLNTGDLASRDELGNLAIRGRSKDLIIHKGFNIYPAEVENILMRHPAVFKAAVIGQDEASSGQVPVAFVAIRANKNANLEESLREWCAGNLASYKIPRKFVCLDDLPMNATGKVDKKQLHV